MADALELRVLHLRFYLFPCYSLFTRGCRVAKCNRFEEERPSDVVVLNEAARISFGANVYG